MLTILAEYILNGGLFVSQLPVRTLSSDMFCYSFGFMCITSTHHSLFLKWKPSAKEWTHLPLKWYEWNWAAQGWILGLLKTGLCEQCIFFFLWFIHHGEFELRRHQKVNDFLLSYLLFWCIVFFEDIFQKSLWFV